MVDLPLLPPIVRNRRPENMMLIYCICLRCIVPHLRRGIDIATMQGKAMRSSYMQIQVTLKKKILSG
jgi:hypothetical protein